MDNILIKESSKPGWGKEKRSIAAMIQAWGNQASNALLDPTFTIFETPTIDGIIGYRLRLKCAVVFGDPVCSQQDMLNLVRAFKEFCTKQGYTIAYTLVSEQFTNWAMQNGYSYAIEMGRESFIDPMIDPKTRTGIHAGVLRNKWRLSIKRGITVKEHKSNDAITEQAMEEVAQRWIANRKGPQIHFFTSFNIFDDRQHKRYFYAECDGKIIGIVALNRLDAYDGWILQMTLLVPEAPTSTSEFLVLSILETLRIEGCRYLTIGITPNACMERIEGFGSITRQLAKRLHALSYKVFKLDKRSQYWRKFDPQEKSLFIVMDKKGFLVKKGLAIVKAYNAAVW